MDGDAEAMLKWYDDMEFMRNVDTDIAFPNNKEENEKVIKNVVSHKDFMFHIRPVDTDELLGFAALDGIEWNNGCCMMSIGIGEKKNRGRGYGREAMQLLLEFAFLELNLHRVGLNFIAYNEKAEALYQSCGFVREGRVREYVHRDGEYYDLVYMGILHSEWAAT